MSFLLLAALSDAAEYRRDRDGCTRCASSPCADHAAGEAIALLYDAARDELAVKMAGTGLARGQTDPGMLEWVSGIGAAVRSRYDREAS